MSPKSTSGPKKSDCRLSACLAGRLLTGWLASWLAGLLAGWLAAGLLTGRLAENKFENLPLGLDRVFMRAPETFTAAKCTEFRPRSNGNVSIHKTE